MARTPRTLLAVLLVAAGATAIPAAAQARGTQRIVGGTGIDVSQTPWMAALLERGEPADQAQFCGGAVVAPRVVVTAAHCVFDASANDVDVLTGRTRLSGSGGQRIQVGQIRVHPGYDNTTVTDDIAVLILKEPTTATPLAVASSGDAALTAAGRRVGIEGWGTTSTNGPSSDTLLAGSQVVLNPTRCERSWDGLDTRTQFCAVGSADGQPDTCPGDSGGPLIANAADGSPRLVGIVSFGGDACGVTVPPSVYTRVSAFSGFVAKQIPGAPTPPTPEPPNQTGKVKLKFGGLDCGYSCRVQVKLSGDGAMSVTSVAIRAIGPGGKFDQTILARRVGARAWRSQIDLPFGKDRIVATAFDRDGNPVGNRLKTTVKITPA